MSVIPNFGARSRTGAPTGMRNDTRAATALAQHNAVAAIVNAPREVTRRFTVPNTQPPISVQATERLSASSWNLNTYYRDEALLDPDTLTPLERGHVYSAKYVTGVGMWVVAAPRLVDEESGWLFEGIGAEAGSAETRTRWPGQVRNIQMFDDRVYVPDSAIDEVQNRVIAAGGSFTFTSPRPGRLAEYSLDLLNRARLFHSNLGSRADALLQQVAGMTSANWATEVLVIQDRWEAVATELKELREALGALGSQIHDEGGSPDTWPPDRIAANARHTDTTVLLDQAGRLSTGLGVQRAIRATVERLARDQQPEAHDPMTVIRKIAEGHPGLEFIENIHKVAGHDHYRITLTNPDGVVRFLPTGAEVRLSAAQLQRLLDTQLREPDSTPAASGDRFNV